MFTERYGLGPYIKQITFGLYKVNIIIIIIIIIITIFLHGLGLLTFSGIDALPSFPGASTISSS
jgi:flagellar basal body-associated protein FliL